MTDYLASLRWMLKNVSLWQNTAQVFRITVGLILLGLQTIYQFFQRYNVVSLLFNIVRSLTTYLITAFLKTVKLSFLLVKSIILVVFAPFNLFIKILDYNSRIFINFWLALLFDTKLEKILTFENGLIHIELLTEWVRFFNVMCITGLVLGLFTYYSLIRTIYWMTKVEKTKKKDQKQLKANRTPVYIKSGAYLNARPRAPTLETKLLRGSGPSILKDYIEHEQSNQKKTALFSLASEESSPVDRKIVMTRSNQQEFDAKSYTSNSTVETLSLKCALPEEDEDDDVTNYESLGQLSNKTTPLSSPLVSSTSINLQGSIPSKHNSPVTSAFRSRLVNARTSNKDDNGNSTVPDTDSPTSTVRSLSEPSTVNSNIFTMNRLPPQTPITTIEEDDEEEGEGK